MTSLTPDERTWGMLCHLSGLIAMLLSLLSFLGPLICWVIKKDTSAWVDYHGKEALNFHLTLLILNAILFLLGFVTCGVTWMALIGTAIYGIVMSIIGTLAANDGKRYAYPGVVRLIK